MNAYLANYSAGRVLLHVVCLVRHPRRAQWHWSGILREFLPATRINHRRSYACG
jgi:hypothetical protein